MLFPAAESPEGAAAPASGEAQAPQVCSGQARVAGLGQVEVVSAQWRKPTVAAGPLKVYGGGVVSAGMGSRTYFAETCDGQQQLSNVQYKNLKLLGRKLRYFADVSTAKCGCSAALYLTSMSVNSNLGDCQDHYCDARNTCGVLCDQIDVQVANRHAWFSTLHAWNDEDGHGGGFGAGRKEWNASVYGPGARCVDTNVAFAVTASFPVGSDGLLKELEVKLEQPHKPCHLVTRTSDYASMAEITSMLQAGVTLVMSYTGIGEDLSWLDGSKDGVGPSCTAQPESCGQAAKFWGFAVE